MKPYCGIYVIQNKITGDCYFGQSVRVEYRLLGHTDCLIHGHHDNSRLLRAFNKYGIDNFIFAPILYCEKDELTYYEQKCVDIFQSTYNIRKECVDSQRGLKHSEETRKKLSAAWQKRKLVPFSAETRRKISIGNIGKKLSVEARQKVRESLIGNTHCTGRKLSASHKEKIGAAGRGKKASPETLVRLRESHLGHVMPDEQKDRLRLYMTGNTRAKGSIRPESAIQKTILANTGRKHTDIARQHMSAAQKGRIISAEARQKISEFWRKKREAKANAISDS